MSEELKLVELRRKTDRDLLILVRRALDRGLMLADVAATKESPLYAQAERAYETVKVLLPLVSAWDPSRTPEIGIWAQGALGGVGPAAI